LNTNSDFSYFVNLSPNLISELASGLGVNASNPVQLIDAMAIRGFKLFDYWKINGLAETVKENDGSTTLTSRGLPYFSTDLEALQGWRISWNTNSVSFEDLCRGWGRNR
jgi:hypothetical protein